jgi:acyl-coenzyme A thioesterase PaaI-like protein
VINDGKCFVCGSKNGKGLNLCYEIDKENQSALCRTVLPEDFEGWRGFIHGGVTASILDGAMVHACLSRDLRCVTAELNIKYKNPIPTNREIEIKSVIKRKFSALLTTEAVITVDGVIAATANAKMFAVKELE